MNFATREPVRCDENSGIKSAFNAKKSKPRPHPTLIKNFDRRHLGKKGNALVSKTPLPEGEVFSMVAQVRAKDGAKLKNFRRPLLLHACDGCKRAEYACTCEE